MVISMTRLMTTFHHERSRYDIKHFYEWLGYRWGDHIGTWLDLYGDRKDAQVHRVCIIAPRDHSKSTTLRVKALHMLLFQRWRGLQKILQLLTVSQKCGLKQHFS